MSPAVTTTWERLSGPADFGLVGFTLVHQAAVLAVVVHLIRHRNWSPYVTKHVALVATTGAGSSFSLLGGLVASGIFSRREGDLLASCSLETALQSIGTALHFFPAFVRVYRNYMLLILHKAAMWSTMAQLQIVLWPYIAPAFIYLVKPSMWEFEEYRNQCFGNPWIGIASFFYMAVGVSTVFVLVVRMRRVRTQLNEFRVMLLPLAFLAVWALYILPAGLWFGRAHPHVGRRLIMVDNFVSTVVLFWCPIGVPLIKHLQKDEQYVWQFTFGFSQLPTPSQMRASLADQLEVEDLRKHFRKYAAGRAAPELPDFYKACIDREEIQDYFERQAATMAIIDRFVVEGAEQEINISEECRRRVLDSEITRYNIFDEAIAEVLHVMEANFKADFERTMEFRELNKAVEREARELQLLRQAKLAPQPQEDDTKLSFSRLSRRFALPRVETNGVAHLLVNNHHAALKAGLGGVTSHRCPSIAYPRTSLISAKEDQPLPQELTTLKVRPSISLEAREEAKGGDKKASVVTSALSTIPGDKHLSTRGEDGDGDDVVSPHCWDSPANTAPTVSSTAAATQSSSSTSGDLRRPLVVHGQMIHSISKLARGLASVSTALAWERQANSGGVDNDGLATSASNSVLSTNRPGKVLVEVMRGLYSATLAVEPEGPVDVEDTEERNGTHRSCGNGSFDKMCDDHEGSEC